MQTPTIVDLAKRLKLDKSTVSRALNGKPGVAPRTRKRVMQAAREHGYIPNIYGQRLRSRRSKTVALVIHQFAAVFTARFHGPLTMEILSAVASRGYDLSVVDISHHPRESLAHVLFQKGAAGAVLMGGNFPAEALDAVQASPLPIMQLDAYSEEHPGLAYVASENFQAIYEMTRHLIDLGHRRLACSCVGPPARLSCFHERYQGFQKALADAGLEEIGISVTRDEHHEAQFLSLTPRPTAIVGLCDTYAENTLIAAREAGLSVPDDLSVTGFDDVDQTLVRAVSLTTVRVDLAGMARTAIDFLLNQDQTAEKQTEFRVGTELILRGSTAPPPADTGASI